MSYLNIKIPTSKADMEELVKSLRSEISEDDLDNIVGGNDDLKKKQSVPFTCPFCGAQMMIKAAQDAAKHMTKCPNNPYK